MKKFFGDDDDYYTREQPAPVVEDEFGCGYCWDKKRKKSKELFFLDAANNMRVCNYCPYCGRAYEGEM